MEKLPVKGDGTDEGDGRGGMEARQGWAWARGNGNGGAWARSKVKGRPGTSDVGRIACRGGPGLAGRMQKGQGS